MRPVPSSRSPACALAIALLCVGDVALAADDPAAPIALVWTAPAGCPSQQGVRDEIERLLGGPPDPSSPRHLRAEAQVARGRDGGFRVHITTDMGGAVGERDLDAASCAALAKAAALILAFTFDPEAVAKRSGDGIGAPPAVAPPPPAAPAVPPAVAPQPPPILSPRPVESSVTRSRTPVVVSPARARERLPRVMLGATTGMSVGALPSLAASVGGGVGLAWARLRFDVAGAYSPDQVGTVVARPSVGGHLRLVAFDERACYAVLLTPIELAPCAGLSIGSMSASGFGVKRPGSGAALWIAPLVEASAALPIGEHFALRVDLGGLAPLLRPSFVLERVGTVHRASALVGRAALTAEARF